jgi:hypothetical protein
VAADEKAKIEDAEYKTTSTAVARADEKSPAKTEAAAVARVEEAKKTGKLGNIADFVDAKGFADLCVKSGLFKDTTDMAKAVMKISYGRSLGIDEVTAMQAINIISGKMAFTSALVASRIKKSGKYRYEVVKKTATECGIQFFEKVEDWTPDGKATFRWVKPGPPEVFTFDMAKRAGLTRNQTWANFPEAMLFARALTAGARTYTPEIFEGLPAYSAEELAPDRARVSANGDVVVEYEDEPAPAKAAPKTPKPKPPPALLAEVKGLVKELGVDAKPFLELYKVAAWDGMDEVQLADVKGKLEIRKRATAKGG